MDNTIPLDLANQNCVDVFLQGYQNWKNFSRLEKIEFAYKAMEAIRDYMCIENGLDPASMGVFFQTLNGGSFKISGLMYIKLVPTLLSISLILFSNVSLYPLFINSL